MREVCSCGAVFEFTWPHEAFWADSRVEKVHELLKEWRETHRHEREPEAEPERAGAGMSDNSMGYVPYYGDRQAVIGFTPNER